MDVEILTEQSTQARIAQEVILMAQKVQTERAQTIDGVAGVSSVLGRQGALYQAQTDGYKNDALQKAATIMADTWKTRRVTDESVQANTENTLHDDAIGLVIRQMLRQAGVPGI
jgi:hypothetical protein